VFEKSGHFIRKINRELSFIMKGWIYIISNRSMVGLVKIGWSSKDPSMRAKELNNTGCPHSYQVEYEALLENPYNVEQAIHKHFKDIREGKEWFRCKVDEAVLAIRQHFSKEIIHEVFHLLEKQKILERERAIQNEERLEWRSKQFKYSLETENSRIVRIYEDKLRYKYPEISFFRVFVGCFIFGLIAVPIFIISLVTDFETGKSTFHLSDKQWLSIALFFALFSSYLFCSIHRKFQLRSRGYKEILNERAQALKKLQNSKAVFVCSSCNRHIYLSGVSSIRFNCANCKTPVDPDRDVLAFSVAR
jgi:T5orf172 domain